MNSFTHCPSCKHAIFHEYGKYGCYLTECKYELAEVAKEIFEEIDNIIYNLRDSPFYSSSDAVDELIELKKKYIGELQDAEIY